MIAADGKVGIGTTSAQATLDIVNSGTDTLSLTSTSSTGYSELIFRDDSGAIKGDFGYANSSATYYAGKVFIDAVGGADLQLGTGAVPRIHVSGSDGNVGIGSNTPAVELDVAGAITATDVVTATGFAPTATTATGNRLYLPAANTLGLAINGAGEVQLTGTALSPVTTDGNALGTTSLMWADLFLASGAVINFNNGDVTITHAADNLAIAGGTLTMGTNGGTNGQITFAGSTSGTVAVRAAAAAGTGTIFQLPADNGTNGYVLQTDGSGVTSWVAAGSPSADSLDFDDFTDTMALDASTSITADNAEVLSIVNTGSGNSFLVEDEASTDATPFVIDASGQVGIGSATPAVKLDVVGAVTATGVATATGFAPTASTATGNRLYLPAADTLGLAIAGAGEVQLTGTALSPVTTDGNALGTSSLMWSDLFLASGAVINFDNGDVTATHAANALAFAGASSGYTFDAGVGIGTTSVAASALLDMVSTAQGFLPPRMTEAQRDAIATPATGLVVYNTDTDVLNFYDGDSWEVVGTGVGVAADSLDFDDFMDAMTLDASTSITADNAEVLSIVNTGTGNSFLVEDEASTDATPFVIDASGQVGIGSATPAVALDVVGAVTATGVATATGFAPTASTATGNRLYLPAADTLGLAIAGAGEVQLTGTALSPVTTDGNALGTSTRMWSDLFLAEEGIISFDNGNMTIEHSTNALIIAGGDVDVWGTLSGDTISADRFVPLDDGGTAIDNSMYLAATNTLGFSINGTGEVQLTSTALSPITNNGNALGTTSLMWSDLFLASGAVVNFNNGDVTITHAADNLAIAGGTLTMGTNGGTNGQITFAGSTSGTVAVRAAAAAGTGTIFQLPADNGTNGYVLQTDGAGVTSWVDPGAATVGDDSLDFDKFVDAMTLDASTSITADGTEVLSIVNTGTGNSFLVEDQASDTTPFVIAADGKVGIGSATPAVALDVVGAVTATGAFTSGTNGGTNGQITFAGSTSGTVAVRAAAAAGTGTIFQLPADNGTSGYQLTTDGNGVLSWAAAGGAIAIDDLTDAETEYSSQHNMFLGSGSGAGIQSGGQYNLALGELALAAVTTGDHNLALGYGALDSLTTSLRNVGIGYNALTAITTGGNDNVALGYNAGAAITTADETVAIGFGALASLTTSLRNTAVGFNTLEGITNSGNDNTALGYRALQDNIDGGSNTAVGSGALLANEGRFVQHRDWLQRSGREL